ncbi:MULTISPECIES: Crp/Fnr family transcriptional regulator [Novosphingobium]|uniref:Crp/Fnr family transcriptional regulator n=1 Tax=Novosphingobium decolorationis TaxID=2698673 RepID=A0ABX8E459_9SPHN|nr:Crp/Fnr family transcriptional regulator [Novosphingobium decolorationis]MBT0668334.1 Crp/Fnr family transcriptional regulator [Novosphingobium profundi]QVM83723.1 Crp/Fnr family transcriptional regulator [Novosphingobium decolorationis]
MTEDEKIDAICAIFRCGADSARLLLPVFSTRKVASRQVLASQGMPCRQCWIVIEGAIRVDTIGLDGQLQQLSHYGPGEFLGSYPEESIGRAEISAANRSVLLGADSPRLAEMIEADVQLASGMARLLARQLDRALDRMVMRTTYTAAGRVYAELMALADSSSVIAPPPKVTNLALAANTTRETASRAINELIRRGIVSRDETRMVIQSPRMIAELIY